MPRPAHLPRKDATMSEYIDNHRKRQETLRALIRRLHDGAAVEDVKAEFARLLQDVGASEIAAVEQALIDGGLPETEVKRLCDVHVAVFRESLDAQPEPESTPGHPVHTYLAENVAAARVLDELGAAIDALKAVPSLDALMQTQSKLQALRQYDKHYLRKENILFPYLEQHGFTGPSSVMWAIHDDVRAGWKRLDELLSTRPADPRAYAQQLTEAFDPLATAIGEMFYKEEHILFPASIDKLSELEWTAVRAQEDEIGYAYVQPGDQWPPVELVEKAQKARPPEQAVRSAPTDLIPLNTGALTAGQIDLLLTNLPVDVTFVDENDQVRFYSQTRERILARSPAIIGRKVQNCHPPTSVHRVQQILDAFRNGTRDEAEFWIQMGGRFIHIRYFALRDGDGTFRGTLELSQDVTGIRALEGERRLLDDSG